MRASTNPSPHPSPHHRYEAAAHHHHSPSLGRAVLSRLQANLAAPPDNATLAAYVCLHPNSFVRLFTPQVGLPPHRDALLARLDRAAHDLLHTGPTVEAIARAWGFTDRQHVTRALRKHRYVTPGQLRRRGG